jgi:beta-N-acetylhexosaminidase
MRRLAPFAAALALVACSSTSTTDPAPPSSPDPTPTASPACQSRDAVADLPLDTRLRQVLFSGVFTGEPDPIASATFASSSGVGGMNFLGNDPEVYANGELAGVTEQAGDIPPFLAVDQEGGRVQRLASLIGSQPSAREMGATMTPAEVEALAAETGQAMAELGLNMDLAPVADVSSQPDDAVIGDRAFSDDPAVVTQYAGAYADGLRSAGIIPVLKHFPGIGSASGNTDFEPATSPPLSQLQAVDMVPYETLLQDEPVAVMMGSAVIPDLTDGEPAGLSPPAVDLLRTDLGFDGVVMTDSLSGAAVSSRYTLPEAAELALIAGVDMVLWDSSGEIEAIVTRLQEAIAAGRLTEDRINVAVARVLDLKQIDACTLTDQP